MKQLKQKNSLLYLLLLCVIACAIAVIVAISGNTTHTAFAATGEYDSSVESSEITQSTTTIIFQKNGGSGGSSLITATYGEDMPEATAPTLKDYKFLGYYLEMEGGTQYYDENMNSVHIWDKTDEICELYAHWKQVKFTVNFDFAGGEGGTKSVEVEYGADMPLGLTAPTKAGYDFLGYFSEDGTKYYDENMNSVHKWDKEDDEYVLYAYWEGEKFKVMFNFTGGEGGTESVEAVYGEDMPSGLTAPTKAGYDFLGYFSEDGTKYYDKNMKSEHKWDFSADGELYALWKPITYTVIFNFDGGKGGTEYVLATYDEDMPSGVTKPTKVGCTFNGYYDQQDGQGTKYYNADLSSAHIWDIPETTTLYAYWTELQTKITYNLNGGTNNSANPSKINYGHDEIILAPATRIGFIFDGWYKNGVKIESLYKINEESITLEATWKTRIDASVYTLDRNLQVLDLSTHSVGSRIILKLPSANFLNPCNIIIPSNIQQVHIFSSTFNNYDLYITINSRNTDLDLYLENFAMCAPLKPTSSNTAETYDTIFMDSESSGALNLYTYGNVSIYGSSVNRVYGYSYKGSYAINCKKLNIYAADNLYLRGGYGTKGGSKALSCTPDYIPDEVENKVRIVDYD